MWLQWPFTFSACLPNSILSRWKIISTGCSSAAAQLHKLILSTLFMGCASRLKTEGLPYHHLHLPSIDRAEKLPVILSRQEIWAMLHKAQLLKHRILIGLLYGCGLRCMEVRNVRLRDMDFDRKLLHVVQSKGNKDRYIPLSEHLIRGIKNT